MSLLLPARKKAVLLGVKPVNIHGQEFMDLLFRLEEEPDTVRRARVGSTDVEGPLEPGCTMLVQFVMGTPISFKRDPN